MTTLELVSNSKSSAVKKIDIDPAPRLDEEFTPESSLLPEPESRVQDDPPNDGYFFLNLF